MNLEAVYEYVKLSLKQPPPKTPQYSHWITQEDLPDFLKGSIGNDVPVCVASKSFFLFSLIMPTAALKDNYVSDLLRWEFKPERASSYNITQESGSVIMVSIIPPLDIAGELLSFGEPFTFYSYASDLDSPQNMHICEGFANMNQLSYDQQRQSFCRRDAHGQAEDVVKVLTDGALTLATVDADLLDAYLSLTDSVLLRLVDVRRRNERKVSLGGSREDRIINDARNELYLRLSMLKDEDSWARGFHVVRGASQAQARSELFAERAPIV